MNSLHNTNNGNNKTSNITNNTNLAYETEISKQIINLDELQLQAEGCINPFNKNNKPITINWVQNLLKKYNIYQNINNLDIYQQAFIHQSYTETYVKEICLRDNVTIVPNPDGCMLLQNNSYERLEWLGDCLIDTFVGTYIYQRFPDANEGFLSSLKKALISRWVLSKLAQQCNFPEYMVISKTLDDKCDARHDIKKCCDIFEAFIGALYMDFNNDKHGFLSSFLSGPGFQVAEKFFINVLEDLETEIDICSYITDNKDYIILIRNYCSRILGCKNIKYDFTVNNELNTDNIMKWKCIGCLHYKDKGIKQTLTFTSNNKTRKLAKSNVAEQFLKYFSQI